MGKYSIGAKEKKDLTYSREERQTLLYSLPSLLHLVNNAVTTDILYTTALLFFPPARQKKTKQNKESLLRLSLAICSFHLCNQTLATAKHSGGSNDQQQ